MKTNTVMQTQGPFRRMLKTACTLILFWMLMPAAGAQGVAPAAGDGSELSPWEIATLENLIWVQQQTNGSGGSHWSANTYFIQTADIDMIAIDNWTPIGIGTPSVSSAPANSFQGIYDGQNFVIRNLKINSSSTYRGLFGFIWGATLINIRIENADVTAEANSGILLGASNCWSCSPVPQASIERVSVRGTIKAHSSHTTPASGERIGGIVGNPARETFITGQNVFIGEVTGTQDVGGLVGRASGNSVLSFSYARAKVTGTNVGSSNGVGILTGNASTNAGSFVEMYAEGEVVVTSGTQNKGAIGIAPNPSSGNHIITDVWYDNKGGLALIGNVGLPNPAWVTITGGGGLTTSQMQGSSASTNMTGSGGRWDFGVDGAWRVVTIPEDDYPVFEWQAGDEITISGKVTADNKDDVGSITVTAQVGDETFSDVTTLTDENGDYSFDVYTVPTRRVFARTTDNDGLPIGAAVARTFTETTTVDLNLQPRSLTISSDPDNGWVRDGTEILAVEEDAVLYINTLRDLLLAGDVTIVAGVDILLNEEFKPGPGATHALTLHAGGKIELQEGARIETYGNIILESDDLDIHSDARLESDKELFIRPRTAATTIGIAGATGTLQLPASYFTTNFEDGFSQITIGGPAQSGIITLNGISFRDDMRLKTSETVLLNGGQIIILPAGLRLQVDNSLQMKAGARIDIE